MPQDQVLRAGRRTDRIGLHELQAMQRALQRRRREEALCDRHAPQLFDAHGHGQMLSKRAQNGIGLAA